MNNTNNLINFTIKKFSLGNILIARSEIGVCAILIDDDINLLKNELYKKFRNSKFIEDSAQLKDLPETVINFIEQKTTNIDVKLDLHGTNFQKQVWNMLRSIPIGSTTTYSKIAIQIGKPKAFRAVAAACAANHIAIIIPCHRVIRSNGDISGYKWGIERKVELLKRENAN